VITNGGAGSISAAEVAQPGSSSRIEAGRVAYGRAGAERERLPPFPSKLWVCDGHYEGAVLDVVSGGVKELGRQEHFASICSKLGDRKFFQTPWRQRLPASHNDR
jgi:hypothetical protein